MRLGPDALLSKAYASESQVFVSAHYHHVAPINPGVRPPVGDPHARHLAEVQAIFAQTVAQAEQLAGKGEKFLCLTGDHSSAAGVLAGIKAAHPGLRLGVVWIDAHADLHTPWTTPTGNLHGCPMGAALNLPPAETPSVLPETAAAWHRISNHKNLAPYVLPEDVAYVGIRAIDSAEADALNTHHIFRLQPPVLRTLAPDQLCTQVAERLQRADVWYVSFDTDSLEPTVVPGTGTPEPGGLGLLQAAALLQYLWRHPKTIALEFTELAPLLDIRGMTAQNVFGLLEHALAPEAP